MEQFLPRGLQVDNGKRIKKMLSSGDNWQIYSTNIDTYVLAVDISLYDQWTEKFELPVNAFQNINDRKVLIGSNDYMISSLEYGPYPENAGQIEAFSIAFKIACETYPDTDFADAIYVEEYSLILPVSPLSGETCNEYVYGRWLTAGINISINSFDRVSKVMSWLDREKLKKCVSLAGFDVAETLDPENDMSKAAEAEKASGAAQRSTTKPDAPFTLLGRPDLESFFNDNIIDVVLNREKYERMGISFPGATILYGPPGCGKTYAIDRLCEYLKWERFDIDSSTIASPYIHDTSKKISEIFHAAMEVAPSVLVIDEMEAFLSDRSSAGVSGTHHLEEMAEFLRRIPEAISNGVLIFAMTNLIDSIDPAILRRGRFDHIVEVKMPSAVEIEALLVAKFKELPVAEDVDAGSVAKMLDQHPMSDVTFVLREAGRIAVKNDLDRIDSSCINSAMATLPKKKEQSRIGF